MTRIIIFCLNSLDGSFIIIRHYKFLSNIMVSESWWFGGVGFGLVLVGIYITDYLDPNKRVRSIQL